MARTHALVIISVRPWLEMQGLHITGGGGLRVSKMGKLQDKGKVHVHASDCGFAHCNGCVVNGISARTASEVGLPACSFDS